MSESSLKCSTAFKDSFYKSKRGGKKVRVVAAVPVHTQLCRGRAREPGTAATSVLAPGREDSKDVGKDWQKYFELSDVSGPRSVFIRQEGTTTSEAHGRGVSVSDKHSSTKEAINAEGARDETRMRCKALHLSSVS